MAVYAVLNAQMHVVNLIEWDGVAQWSPPPGCTVALYNPQTMGALQVHEL